MRLQGDLQAEGFVLWGRRAPELWGEVERFRPFAVCSAPSAALKSKSAARRGLFSPTHHQTTYAIAPLALYSLYLHFKGDVSLWQQSIRQSLPLVTGRVGLSAQGDSPRAASD